MKELSPEQIWVQAQVFVSPEIHHESLVLLRESVFTMVCGLFAKVSGAPPGESIVVLGQKYIEANKSLVDALRDSWDPSPEKLFGEPGWRLLEPPLKAFSDLLNAGQPVLGDESNLLFSLVTAERVQMGLRDCHRLLERAIKRRDPRDNSPLDKSVLRLGSSHE